MKCPNCGRTMQYLAHGWHWDDTPAHKWRCLGCWSAIWDGEPAWPIDLCLRGLVVSYIDRYGCLPFETQRPPVAFAVQLRML